MPHIEIEVLLSIQLQHHFRRLQRDSLRAGPVLPPVVESVVPHLFVAFPPPPHCPVGDPDDLGCLPPLQASSHSFQNHFLYFHHPLHFCGSDHLFRVHSFSVPSTSSGQFIC